MLPGGIELLLRQCISFLIPEVGLLQTCFRWVRARLDSEKEGQSSKDRYHCDLVSIVSAGVRGVDREQVRCNVSRGDDGADCHQSPVWLPAVV